MRPVELLLAANHPFYDGRFDRLLRTSMFKVGDFSWTLRDVSGKKNKALTDALEKIAVYDYFRNGTTWTLRNKDMPPAPKTSRTLNAKSTPVLFVAPPSRDLNATTIPLRDRAGANTIVLNPKILRILKPTSTLSLRIVIPPDEITDALSAWNNLLWNRGTLTDAKIGPVMAKIWKQIIHADAVPRYSLPHSVEFYSYKAAMRELKATLGAYCSYCETRGEAGSGYDVEHRLPKALYHSEVLRWSNFLIGCTVCNEYAKGDQPDRQFGIETAMQYYWPGVTFTYPIAPPNPREKPPGRKFLESPIIPGTTDRIPYDKMREMCEYYYIWPSVDDNVTPNAPIPSKDPGTPRNYSLLAVQYRLYEFDIDPTNPEVATEKGEVPMAEAIDLRNGSAIHGPGDTVKADIWNRAMGHVTSRHVRVKAIATSPGTTQGTFNARKQAAATNTIRDLRLNDPVKSESDGRIVARTLAWFQAIAALRALLDQLAFIQAWNRNWLTRTILGLLLPQLANDPWQGSLEGAESGYYSVWVTVFKHHSAIVHGNNHLAEALVTRLQERANLDTSHRYRGTNHKHSVIDMLARL